MFDNGPERGLSEARAYHHFPLCGKTPTQLLCMAVCKTSDLTSRSNFCQRKQRQGSCTVRFTGRDVEMVFTKSQRYIRLVISPLLDTETDFRYSTSYCDYATNCRVHHLVSVEQRGTLALLEDHTSFDACCSRGSSYTTCCIDWSQPHRLFESKNHP